DGQSIYVLDPAQMTSLVPPPATGRAALVAGRTPADGDVARMLGDSARGLPPTKSGYPSMPNKQGLTLDSISQPSIGVGATSYGGYVGGSVSFLFGDMLGDRALGIAASVN